MSPAVSMSSRCLIDTEDWSGSQSRWTPALGNAPGPRLTYFFAQGYAAAKRGDLHTARTALAALQSANREAAAGAKERSDASPRRIESEKRARVLDLELQAGILAAESHHDNAIALLRQATAIEDRLAYSFGPPGVDKPSLRQRGEELPTPKQIARTRSEFRL